MKLTLLLLLLFTMQISASVSMHGQVTLKMQNESIRDVFKEIENQSPYRFFYNEAFADLNKRVNINVDDKDINSTMNELLLMSDMSYKVLDNNLVVIAPRKELQQHVVTGRVTEAGTGELLPGVNILIEGTQIGTVTDIDGQYTLTVPDPNAILIVSYIGYTRQRVLIEGRSVVDVILQEEIRQVEEVVVIGYGTRLREELTGSVATMAGDRMEISSASTAIGRIQGQISGVTVSSANTPGGEAAIRVRGLGTINDNEPLYIIDGVPSSPGSSLNPNDIESISVLKDASSAAIYGTRGANGVVIITTKRGREGQRPSVRFTTRTGIMQATKWYDLLNTQERAEMAFLEARNMGHTPGVDWTHSQYGSGSQPIIPDYIKPAGAKVGDPGTSIDDYRFPDYMIVKSNKQGTNWFDEISQNGMIQEYDLSVTGGGENIAYAVSGSYLNEEGYLINTGFDRFTLRNNTDARFNDWFKAGHSMQASKTKKSGDMSDNHWHGVISQAYRQHPIVPVFDIAGNWAGSHPSNMGESDNPVASLHRGKYDIDNYFRLLGNIFGEVTLIEGLTFRSLLGYNYLQANIESRTLPDPEHAVQRVVLPVAHRNTNYSFQWNWANTLNYSTSFGDDHRLNLILGTEAVDNTYKWISASRAGYYSLDPKYMQLSAGESDMRNDGSGSEWSLFSMFGRVNYDLMGRYLFEATFRRDGSSRFGPDNRYGNFPAASFAWFASRESFMEGTRGWLDILKLRLGWGISGNDRIGDYNVYTTFGLHTSQSAYAIDGSRTATVGFMPVTLGNPDVTWETTETQNLGIDIALLNNTINISTDIWQRYTSDMLYRLRVPLVVGGATAPFVNIGEMENKGFDIEFGYNNTALDGRLRYNLSANISRYVNRITMLSSDVEEEIIFSAIRGMYYTRAKAGSSFPEFYGYIVDGIFQSQEEADAHPPAFGPQGTYNQPGRYKYRDITGSGYVDGNDRSFIGNPHPDFTGGFSIDLGYDNFDLNLFFYGSYGNDMINFTRRYIDFGWHVSNFGKDALYKSWGSPYLDDNRNAKLPIIDQNENSQQPSTAWIEDGSFLRLQNLRVGYRFPERFIQSLQIEGLRVYFQMTNIFTITNYSGLDPDLHSPGGNLGIDQGTWQTPRNIMFGVTLDL